MTVTIVSDRVESRISAGSRDGEGNPSGQRMQHTRSRRRTDSFGGGGGVGRLRSDSFGGGPMQRLRTDSNFGYASSPYLDEQDMTSMLGMEASPYMAGGWGAAAPGFPPPPFPPHDAVPPHGLPLMPPPDMGLPPDLAMLAAYGSFGAATAAADAAAGRALRLNMFPGGAGGYPHGYPGMPPYPPRSAARDMHASQRSSYQARGSGAAVGAERVRGGGGGRPESKASKAAAARAAASASASVPDEGKTTVMLRNLPDGFTREALIEMLDSEGFNAKYDFAYLPVDFDTLLGLKHAFVNMLTPVEAAELRGHLEGFTNWDRPSDSVCAVAWNDRQQGLSSLVDRYRNSPVMHESVPDECKPVILVGGKRAIFPPPTQKIKAPKILKGKPQAPQA